MSTILIVDDDDQLRISFQKLLSEEGYAILTASTGESGLELLRDKVPDLVIMDIRMPGMSGLEAFHAIRKIDRKLPVIIMTAFGTTETAIEATKLGAFDYILKPFDIPEVLNLIDEALSAGRFMKSRVEMNVDPQSTHPYAIIGNSEPMQEIYKAIGRVAPTDATVLIRGETGTGKELIARAIYQHSLRADKPFLVINCVAIPETLLESELFGYERGAFTGAVTRRIGKIEQANGGTVLLDEIGDMPLSIQAKLLRLLEERRIERLGGQEFVPVDVRILAATNRDLEHAISDGRFREDLYYRLRVVSLNLPPLRDRKKDVIPLSDFFLARFSREMNIDNPGMLPEAKDVIERHNWPGNVRELANAMKKALIFSRGCPIRPEDMTQSLTSAQAMPFTNGDVSDKVIRQLVRETLSSGGKDLFNHLMDRFSVVLISEALRLTEGNRSRAAKLLGLSRPTLQAKIEKYAIKVEAAISHPDSSEM